MIDQVTSRYRVLRELGRGGMGVVYVVEHVHTGERLALKVLHSSSASDPEVLARFRREARAGAQIRSEHVIRVTDADVAPELGGAPFFVMELLDGLDFEKLVGQVGPLHGALVTDLLTQVAKALGKAHALGIVHRDLKPENLFLHLRDDDVPIAKILDFGISKFLHPQSSDQAGLLVTRDGMLMGTPYYMSPEQARGDVEAIGPSTDIWALGLVALKLLTAEGYWSARTQADLMVQLLAAPMVAPSDRWPFLGVRFDRWFERSCHRHPAQRWTSAVEQVAALSDALEGCGASNAATMTGVLELLHQRRGRAGSNSSRPKVPSAAPRTATVTAVPAASFQAASSTLAAETSAQTNLVHTAREDVRGPARRMWVAILAASAIAAIAAALFGRWLVRVDSPKAETSHAAQPPAAESVAPLPTPLPAVATPIAPRDPAVMDESSEPIAKPRTAAPRPASIERVAPRTAASGARPQHAAPTPSAQPAPPPSRTATPKDDDILRP